MVDSIRNGARASIPNGNLRTDSLRKNFKSLSSGLRVSDSGSAAVTDNIRANRAGNSERVAKVVENLNEAASFSNKALQSLEGTEELSESEAKGVAMLRDFAEDIGQLREDIREVLEVLQHRAGRAEVAQENLNASDVELRDVTSASKHAQNTGSQISFNGSDAVDAHGKLNPEAVNSLLGD